MPCQECQNLDWAGHKLECAALRQWASSSRTAASEKSTSDDLKSQEFIPIPNEAIRVLGRLLWSMEAKGLHSHWVRLSLQNVRILGKLMLFCRLKRFIKCNLVCIAKQDWQLNLTFTNRRSYLLTPKIPCSCFVNCTCSCIGQLCEQRLRNQRLREVGD